MGLSTVMSVNMGLLLLYVSKHPRLYSSLHSVYP